MILGEKKIAISMCTIIARFSQVLQQPRESPSGKPNNWMCKLLFAPTTCSYGDN